MKKWYRKYDYRAKIYTDAGWPIPFKDFGGSEAGLFTQDEYTISQLSKCIAEQRGGVQEITEAEYEELKKKESPKPSLIWRESISLRSLARMRQCLADAAAAGKKMLPEAVRNFSPNGPMTKPSGMSEFRPGSVAR